MRIMQPQLLNVIKNGGNSTKMWLEQQKNGEIVFIYHDCEINSMIVCVFFVSGAFFLFGFLCAAFFWHFENFHTNVPFVELSLLNLYKAMQGRKR